MHKLRVVIRHEYTTIIKQTSFWLIMVAIPVLIGGVIGLSVFADKSSDERLEKLSKDIQNVAIIDESGLIKQQALKGTGLSLTPTDQKEAKRQLVQNGGTNGLIVYPANLKESRTFKVYLNGNDFTKSQTVASLAESILETSVYLPLGSADIIALAKDGAESTIVNYDQGRETAGVNEYIVPAAFVVLFYIIFAFSVGYMLSSVGEEKENRSMEMVLTYTNERSVIIGKLIAVSLIALTQILFFAVVGLVGLLISTGLGTSLTLPAGVELSRLVFDPMTLILSTGFLIAGFLMFAGFMTAVASIMPSVKEANNLSSVFYIGAFLPFYFITLIMTDPENPITKFLTFFPLTSPVVTLIRNAIGNMEPSEAWLALVVMLVFMSFSLWLAIKAFRLGALEFSNRISFKKLLK